MASMTRSILSSRYTAARLPTNRPPPNPLNTHPLRPAGRSNTAAMTLRATAREFLEELSKVPGKVRFIVVGEGAILESVSSMSPIKYTDVPKKGFLATISTEDKAFEAHVFLSKVHDAKLVKGERHVVRLLGEAGKPLMSLVVQEAAGWQALHDRFGDSVEFEQNALDSAGPIV